MPGLPKTEVVKLTCDICGKPVEKFRQYDNAGAIREPKPTCSICFQTQREQEYIKQANEGLSEACQIQRDKWFDIVAENFPAKLADKIFEIKWDGFDKKLQPKAFNVMRNFKDHSIILSSPDLYGVGKTYLSALLVSHLIDTAKAVEVDGRGSYFKHKCPVYMITETKLLARIRATYNRTRGDESETEDECFNFFSQFQLLIIDDIGKVRPHDFSFLQGVYFRIIDERYNNEQKIILTTNLTPDDLEKHIGGACADRLKEMCGPGNIVIMKGKSYRGTEKPV